MGQRNALRRTLMTQLFERDRITTTEAKAKFIRSEAERLITLAKRGLAAGDDDQGKMRLVHARRLVTARLNDPKVMAKLFETIAPRYEKRAGGYTRILKLAPRKGDSAAMVLLELVEE